jgi:NadR type nicotinamide-nucleotide adenylyltransferase
MKRGIVIGKFYPPHKGHSYLIDSAMTSVDKLTVIVCDKKGQLIPGQLRAKWLKEMHPAAEVIVIDDILADDDSKGWAEYTIRTLGYVPDVVFTSEDYGDSYAKHMGCLHVLVDKDRKKVPISATKIRENPLDNWQYLSPSVRAYFAKRVVVLGAESTGTTTTAKLLAEHYKTCWVPEFGRTYSEGKMVVGANLGWQSEEFSFIANEQNRMEDELARACNKILICDTDSFATTLWHERYMGYMSSEVAAFSNGRQYEHYFLTDVDIPFVQDGLRDGEHIRKDMHRRFVDELEKNNKPYTILSGSIEDRMKKAYQVCDALLKSQGHIMTPKNIPLGENNFSTPLHLLSKFC